MSRRRDDKYPRVNSSGNFKDSEQKRCRACKKLGRDARAVKWIRMEWTYMRGEDGITALCQEHLDEFRQVYRQWRTGPWPAHFRGEEIWPQ